MANCIKCKKQAGCSCNLNREGLCATCAADKRKAEAEELQRTENLKNIKPFLH